MAKVGYAADMLCMLFGNIKIQKNVIGDWQTVGEYALHVQCVWRFSKNEQIILTYWDLYNASLDDDNTMSDSIFEALNVSMPLEVTDVALDYIGTLKIKLNNDIIFEAFPDRCGEIEHWRFINNETHEHIVFFDEK